MTSFVIDANGSAIMFPGKVLVLTIPEQLLHNHEQGGKLSFLSLPAFAGVEQLLPNDHVEIRLSHPETGEAFYLEIAGCCLEWVPR